jgi:hypothetical protein
MAALVINAALRQANRCSSGDAVSLLDSCLWRGQYLERRV